jgi:hypothetical protein
VKPNRCSVSVSEARAPVFAPVIATTAASVRIQCACGRVVAAQFDCADMKISLTMDAGARSR